VSRVHRGGEFVGFFMANEHTTLTLKNRRSSHDWSDAEHSWAATAGATLCALVGS